jgi:hypothetical protein
VKSVQTLRRPPVAPVTSPVSGTEVAVPMLTEPTSTQRQAFELIGAAIPLTLK